MKRHEKSIADLKLKAGDLEAILCALPLAASYQTEIPEQMRYNADLAATVGQKIEIGAKRFSAEELRIISASISLALSILSNEYDPCAPVVTPDFRADLARYFFNFNRLEPIFAQICVRILEELHQ